MYGSSCLQLSFKIGVPKNFAIFTGKYLCWSRFLIKQPTISAATLLKGDYNTGVFLRFAKTFQNSFLYRAPPFTASKFAKSLFTCLCIHKPCLKTRIELQILSHEARNKILVKYLTS